MSSKEVLSILNKKYIIFLFFVVIGCTPKLIKQGITHFDKGEYDEALNSFHELLQEKPKYYLTHFYLGKIYEVKCNYRNALEEYQKFLPYAKDKKEINLRIERVKKFLMEENYDIAIRKDIPSLYEEFLYKYPRSKYEADIKKRYEKCSFAIALHGGKTKDCIIFLDKFPNSIYTDTIREHLQILQEDSAYYYAIERDNLGFYQQFVQDFPSGKYIQDIKDRILNYYKPKNLGFSVNTEECEALPCIVPDGKTLYFLGEGLKDDRTKKGGIGGEDIWVTYKTSNGWTKAKVLDVPLNSEANEAPLSVTANGDILFSGRCGYNSCDIYFSNREGENWSEPENIGAPINTEGWEARACISADGTKLFFSANPDKGDPWHRTGEKVGHKGYGGVDIWVSFKTEDGWSEPKNLGPMINTPKDEFLACVHSDGRTIYFASDGHGGYGGLDLFKSAIVNGKWIKPINLGPLINTSENEENFSVPASGDIAYFTSSGHESFGCWDIFSIHLPKKAMPTPVTLVSGRILDGKTKEPLEANIDVENLRLQKKIYSIKSNSTTGRFAIALPSGELYGIAISKEGYLFHSENFDLRKQQKYKEIMKDFYLALIEKGAKIIVRNIFFDLDKSTLKPESELELNRLVEIMKEYPNIKIKVSGHTCALGTDEYNMKLSLKRAEAVKEYLTNHNIAEKRIKTEGFGKTEPIASNDTEEGRELNRRVEFKIIEY